MPFLLAYLKRTGFVALSAALVFMLGGTGVEAATGLTIQPIKVSQTLDPGATYTGVINLSNASDKEVIVQVKTEDFLPSAGTNTLNFIGRAPGVTSVRDWITVNKPAEFSFTQGKTESVQYTITVPANAEPGGHFGVIFFKAIEKTDAEEQLKIGTQVGVLVLVTVNGDFERTGKIVEASAPSFLTEGPVPFKITFENTGTVHFEPKGKISITNLFGKEVGVVPIEGQVVLPTGVKDLNFAWEPSTKFLLGKYTATIIIDGDGETPLAEQSLTFYAAPVWYVLGLLLAFYVLWRSIVFLKSRVSINIKPKE